MLVTDDGIIISTKLEQLLNALYPIEVTDDGMTILVNEMHLSKQKLSIIVIDEGNETLTSK